MNTGIYAYRNTINGKHYIGQAVNLERRLREHEYYLERGRDKCAALQRAVSKYGRENFEVFIIEYCSAEVLNELEVHYIKLYNSHGRNGYNVSVGGRSGLVGYKWPKEFGEKISKAKREKHWKMPEEQKRHLSKFFEGRFVSEETRQRMSDSRSGEKHYMFGKKLSEDRIQKMRDSRYGNNAYQFGKKTSRATSKYFGVAKVVSKDKVYWKATVMYKGAKTYVGASKIEIEAARLYDAYVIENGLPNPLNFPEGVNHGRLP